jgi:hypothetical protein
MRTFFFSPDGRLRGLRVGACFYVFNALATMYGEGWRSLSWIAWSLMASGFFALSSAVEPLHPERSKWRIPGYLVGLAAMALGLSILVYRIVRHSPHIST